jgi:hypothetical protein
MNDVPSAGVMNAKPQPIDAYNLEGGLLWLARASVIFFGVLSLVVFVLSTPFRYRQLTAIGFTNGFVLQSLGLPVEVLPNYILAADTILFGIHFLIAALIFIRRSKDRLVLLACIMLVCMATIIPRPGDSVRSVDTVWLQVAYMAVYIIGLMAVCFFLHLFPYPIYIPRWSGILAIGFNAIMVLWYLVFAFGWPLRQLPTLVVAGWIISGISLQVWRYVRFSDEMRRQQTKWVVYGLTCAGIGFLTFNYLLPLLFPMVVRPGYARVLYVLLGVTIEYAMLLALPVSFALSVLRFRLWDVDRIAFRTIVYSGLTAGLAILYFATVLLLQQLFREITRTQSVLGVVISTIAFGLLFNPIRQRAQALIEQRTYHRKYNAAQTLARFSTVAQHEVDIDKLSSALLSSVDEAMQPEHVSMWVKKR